jgi:hypothetical protein
VLAAIPEQVKKYESDLKYYKPQKNLGYCAPKQYYCGATLPIYEINLQRKLKKGNINFQYIGGIFSLGEKFITHGEVVSVSLYN